MDSTNIAIRALWRNTLPIQIPHLAAHFLLCHSTHRAIKNPYHTPLRWCLLPDSAVNVVFLEIIFGTFKKCKLQSKKLISWYCPAENFEFENGRISFCLYLCCIPPLKIKRTCKNFRSRNINNVNTDFTFPCHYILI